MTFPVGTDSKDIDAQPLDVVYFLTLIFLDDYLIGQSGPLHIVDAFHERLLHIQFPSCPVERV